MYSTPSSSRIFMSWMFECLSSTNDRITFPSGRENHYPLVGARVNIAGLVEHDRTVRRAQGRSPARQAITPSRAPCRKSSARTPSAQAGSFPRLEQRTRSQGRTRRKAWKLFFMGVQSREDGAWQESTSMARRTDDRQLIAKRSRPLIHPSRAAAIIHRPVIHIKQ